MIITGQFDDLYYNRYTVEIENTSISGDTIVIGEHYGDGQPDNDLMYFTDDPVETEAEMDDMFTVIGMQSATINLRVKEFVGELLYANNARSVKVKIRKNNQVIFDGYAEAGTFDQPFVEPWDEYTINCVDKLSTLQYYKYRNITPDTLESVRVTLNSVTFDEILHMCLDPVIGSGQIYYDMSKGVNSNRTNLIFSDLKVSEQVFVGDDYDSVWTYEEVLEQMLQYLNLHIRQVGSDFYIFDWDSIKSLDTSWVNLLTNEYVTMSPSLVTITKDMHASTDTSITIDEVYNQIKVTDELNAQENVVESPLDTQNITSPYSNKQLFCTEYSSDGEGNSAIDAFAAMVTGGTSDYDACTKTDWYLQMLESKNWKFYGVHGTTESQYDQDQNGVYINQWKYSTRQVGIYGETGLVGLGSVEQSGGQITDDSPQGYIKLNNYLVISVGGNGSDDTNSVYPDSNWIQYRQPQAEFLSTNTGSVFSPTDDDTTNYLVFSGKLFLQPKDWQTAPYSVCNDAANYRDIPSQYKTNISHLQDPSYGIRMLWHKTVPSEGNEDGRYYTRKYYKLTYPNDPVSGATISDYGLMPPFKDKANSLYEYNYSAAWNNNDTISNLDILECELIIGNKRLVQYYDGDKCQLKWVTLGQEPVQTFPEDGQPYTITTFQLGVNPKIDDKIIGQEFDIRSNIDYTMNVDAVGFAVPIKRSDALSGQVIFRILGAVNTKWNDITRRHPTFFWHTKYYDNWHYILAHTENIYIKEFKCKLYSDNAGYNADYQVDDKDLVYLSNETDNFVEVKDDINFKIITQLTTQEAISKGVKTDINYNAVFKVSDGQQLRTIYNGHTHDNYKPEEHYVSQYYLQYNRPKVILDTEILDEDNHVSYFNNYRYNSLNRDFIVRSLSRTLRENKVHLTLVEK